MPASPDAIYVGQNKVFFVEFKNQHRSSVDKERMQQKFCNGTTIIKDLLKDFRVKNVQYFFCVVYKVSTKQKSYASHIASREIQYGLKLMNEQLGNFYDKIITQDVDFYKKEFKQLDC